MKEATSRRSLSASATNSIQESLFGKTCLASSRCQTTHSAISWPQWLAKMNPSSAQTVKAGQSRAWLLDPVASAAGESSTPNGSGSPKDAEEYSWLEWPTDGTAVSLASILESNVSNKYYLSSTACKGILRRAEKRGKALPDALKAALMAVASGACAGHVVPVVGALACNTGPNGHDAGNFASNQAVDSGYLIPTIAATLRSASDSPACPGKTNGTDRMTLVPTIAPCLTQNYGKQPDNSDTNAGPMLLPVAFTTEQTPKFNNDCALTLTKQSPTGGGQPQAVAMPLRAGRQYSDMGDGQSNVVTVAEEQTYKVRRLSARECERLQAFQWRCAPADPGAWQDELGRWWSPDYTAGFSDSTRYKMLGNAVCVNVIEWIARRIATDLNL